MQRGRPSSVVRWLSRSSIVARWHSDRWWSPMVPLSACPGRRKVVVWASHWRRGRSGNAIGLTKVAHQSAVRAQHGPYCSHTEEIQILHLFSRNQIRIQHSVCLQPHGFRIRILKSRSGFGLIKQGLIIIVEWAWWLLMGWRPASPTTVLTFVGRRIPG